MANICKATDCNDKHLAKGYCSKHYYRYKRGQDVEAPSRFDSRPANIDGDVAYLVLASNKGVATIDAADASLESHNWSLSGDGYPMTWTNGKLMKLHHLVIGKPKKGMVVDHINRDKLDNRKANLRFVTQRKNVHNAGMLSTNTSGSKGVTLDSHTGKWIAQGFFGGRLRYGGRHQSIEDAIVARKKLVATYAN